MTPRPPNITTDGVNINILVQVWQCSEQTSSFVAQAEVSYLTVTEAWGHWSMLLPLKKNIQYTRPTRLRVYQRSKYCDQRDGDSSMWMLCCCLHCTVCEIKDAILICMPQRYAPCWWISLNLSSLNEAKSNIQVCCDIETQVKDADVEALLCS
jgi:hypothetical protein